ncbi:MAG TPA: hypothetical protein VGH27_21850 [Streptosporangiaceae bacterium]
MAVGATDYTLPDYFSSLPAGSRTLIESWNGTAWSTTPSLNKDGAGDGLSAVFSLAGGPSTAVGEYNATPQKSLVETG